MSLSTNKITNVITGVIMAIIFLVVGVALGPTVITNFGLVNATALADVELGSVIVLFASYGPMFYYLAIISGAVIMLVAAAKAGKA